MKIPKGKYIKQIEVNDGEVNVHFGKKLKIALLFVNINERYWSYFKQVVEDCRVNFLPHHNVDYFVWSDMPENYVEGVTIIPTEPIEWPAPTLMRYHLFLQKEEELKDYDYVFYLDADMRVVQKVSDEILGKELTAAPHPGYVLNSRLIPPYEPNPESAAYIHRLGYLGKDEKGNTRFIPFYAAGGFQGGKSKLFIKAMKAMKASIDRDFNKNYTAIWNDESHWNKYLWDFQKKGGDITFLDVSYVYPDSLINEYYIPMWGKKYEPKIITLTKPFTLSKQAGAELHEAIGGQKPFNCPTCNDLIQMPGHRIVRVVECPGSKKPHQVEMVPL
jgi:hypothetical protein